MSEHCRRADKSEKGRTAWPGRWRRVGKILSISQYTASSRSGLWRPTCGEKSGGTAQPMENEGVYTPVSRQRQVAGGSPLACSPAS